jgi:hypothetical protein
MSGISPSETGPPGNSIEPIAIKIEFSILEPPVGYGIIIKNVLLCGASTETGFRPTISLVSDPEKYSLYIIHKPYYQAKMPGNHI